MSTDLVELHLPLAERIAVGVSRKVPRHVDRDDLVSAAYLGLVQASRTYDPDKGVPFETFAARRVMGAVFDQLRSYDMVSRAVRRSAREVSAYEQAFMARHTRRPTVDEVADALEMSPARVRTARQAVTAALVEYDHSDGVAADQISTEELVEDRAMVDTIVNLIGLLPERLQMVVRGTYLDGMTLRAVADRLGVTESRACQIRSEALLLIREALTDRHGPQSRRRERFLTAVAA
jgi:RNA polymerase sigma factor for flagellar operon FliA